jgi:hypothetical protein
MYQINDVDFILMMGILVGVKGYGMTSECVVAIMGAGSGG